MVIYRTPELVTVTRETTIAINHTARTRLRCYWPAELPSIVLERYEERAYHHEDGSEAYRVLDWHADETTRLPATEQRIDGIRGAMGSTYAYCSVHSISTLRDWATREGMSWVARERHSN